MSSTINNLNAVASVLGTDITNIVRSPFAAGDDKKITMTNLSNSLIGISTGLVAATLATASGATALTADNSNGFIFKTNVTGANVSSHAMGFDVASASQSTEAYVKFQWDGDGVGGFLNTILKIFHTDIETVVASADGRGDTWRMTDLTLNQPYAELPPTTGFKQKINQGTGGIMTFALTNDDSTPVFHIAVSGSTTPSSPLYVLAAAKADGVGGLTTLASDEAIGGWANAQTMKWIVLGNGSTIQNGSITAAGASTITTETFTVAQVTSVPAGLATLASPAAPGNVSNGGHSYRTAVRTTNGRRTELGSETNTETVVNNAVNGQIKLTALASSSNPDAAFIDIFRDKNSDGVYKLVGSVANGVSIFTDNIADGSLGVTWSTDIASYNQTGNETIEGTLTIGGGLNLHVKQVGAGAYTMLITDTILGKTAITGGGDTITLPLAATAIIGRIYIIKDQSGGAAAANITVDGNGAETIDGVANVVISANYGVVRLYTNGVAWFTI